MTKTIKLQIVAEYELEVEDDITLDEVVERLGIADSWFMSDIYCTEWSIKDWKEIKTDNNGK